MGLNGAVVVQVVPEIVFLLVALGPTSWKTITWATAQWATKFVFRDVVLAKRLSRGIYFRKAVDQCGPDVDSMWTRCGLGLPIGMKHMCTDVGPMWTRCGLVVDSLRPY